MAFEMPLTGFNFRVFFSDGVSDVRSLESTDALKTAGSLAAALVPAAASGTIRAGFSEINGLNSEIEMEDYREGGRNLGPRRFPKWGRYATLVMRRGITSDTALWDWWADVVAHSYTLATGKPSPRKNGVIVLDRFDHKASAAWFFSNALPERLTGPTFNARGSEIAIETLEISHEGLLRLKSVPSGV